MLCVDRLTLEQVRMVYRSYMVEDFVDAELRSLSRIEALMADGVYEGYGLFEGSDLCGYAFFLTLPWDGGGKCCLFDYLAVRSGLRGKGYGGKFLQVLMGKFPSDGIVLGEVENPGFAMDGAERDLRIRRLSFYLRGGAVDTGVRVRLCGVEFCILEFPLCGVHPAGEVRRAYGGIYQYLFTPGKYREELEIR